MMDDESILFAMGDMRATPLSYGVSVEGDSVSASASGETITITATSAGEAKVTVTGTARMASSSFIPSQTVIRTSCRRSP